MVKLATSALWIMVTVIGLLKIRPGDIPDSLIVPLFPFNN